MYSQVQGPDNSNIGIVIAVLAILALVGGLLYFFVFKCKEDGGECTTTSDCCEGLECIDSKCSSSTPTVSPQPVVVVNNVVNNVEPEPDPGSNTCADWDVGHECATGTTLSPGIGNSPSECCRSLTCGEWFDLDEDNNCATGTTLTPGIGFTQGECCRSLTCGEWDVDNNCATGTTLTPGIGFTQGECCRSLTCGEWDVDNNCASSTTLTPGIGFTQGECCRSLTCGEWDVDNNCPDGDALPGIGNSPIECCSPPHWILSELGKNCNEACGAAGLICEDGEWGIDSEEKYRDIMGIVGVDFGICSRGAPARAGAGAGPWTGNPAFRPRDDGSGTAGCWYHSRPNNQSLTTECSRSGSVYRRMCKCLPGPSE